MATQFAALFRARCVIALATSLGTLALTNAAWAQNEANVAAVTVQEDQTSFSLSNGVITARVSKRSGDLTSLQYKGLEMLTDKSGHAGGYWSHDTTGGKDTITRITIDPRTNGGQRGEVSVQGISGGIKMGHGPAATTSCQPTSRFAIASAANPAFTHTAPSTQTHYPAASMTEARYCAKFGPFGRMT
jgi:rhamnogalacturonan endolyase